MSMNDLETRVAELRELRRLQDELIAETEFEIEMIQTIRESEDPAKKCRVDLQEPISHTPMVTAWAAVYEWEYGQKPNEKVLQIAEHIFRVGKMLTELGQKDAGEGKRAYSASFFPDLVVKAFRLDVGKTHKMVQAVADLWQSDYMDGYREGGAA